MFKVLFGFSYACDEVLMKKIDKWRFSPENFTLANNTTIFS
jgi:hypothetical protein